MDVHLGPESSFPEGELRSFELEGGRYVLVARLAGTLHALDDVCVHAGCLLSGGWLEQGTVVCPCHEYKFDVASGRNVTLPRLCGDQPTFPLRIDADGTVVVALPEPRG